MSLKIKHIDDTSALGTLDGALPFEARRDGQTLTTKIAGWVYTMHNEAISTAGDMRRAVYGVLARYRAAHRQG